MENNNNNGTRTMLYDKNEKKYYLVLKLPKEEQGKLDKNEDLNKSQRSRKLFLALRNKDKQNQNIKIKKTENNESCVIPEVSSDTHFVVLDKTEQQNESTKDSSSMNLDLGINEEEGSRVDVEAICESKILKQNNVFQGISAFLSKKNKNDGINYDYEIYEIGKEWLDEDTKKKLTKEMDKPISLKKSSFRVGYELFFSRIWLGLITPCIVTAWFAPSAFKFLENVFENPLNVFTIWDGFNNPLYNFANAIFCCSGVLGIGLSLMAIVGLFSSQENKKKRREDRKNVSKFKCFSTESVLSIFALVMTGCYATQTVMNMTAQGILPIVTNPLTCVSAVFAVLGFAFSMLNLALRIKDKVKLSKLNKSNENNNGEGFVDVIKYMSLCNLS